MKRAAVICELNPLHNGHARLFRILKEEQGCGQVIALMSGNFVQRGEPAVFDKYSRAKAALLCGADAVFELPPVFALSSADDFAAAGIAAADHLGCTDFLGFGYEDQGLSPESFVENAAACAALAGTSGFNALVASETRKGTGYPAAVQSALKECGISEEFLKLSSLPNNILGIAYIKALLERNSSVRPVPVPRTGDGYHAAVPRHSLYTSAGALRNMFRIEQFGSGQLRAGSSVGLKSLPATMEDRLTSERFEDNFEDSFEDSFKDSFEEGFGKRLENSFEKGFKKGFEKRLESDLDPISGHNSWQAYVPGAVHPLYDGLLSSGSLCGPELFSPFLNLRIQERIRDGAGFTDLLDFSGEISGRLQALSGHFYSFGETARLLKTRQYTSSRIRRCLMHLILDITSEEVSMLKDAGYIRGLRLLGFRKDSAGLLTEIKEKASVPLITRPSQYKDLLAKDVFRDNLYYSVSAVPGQDNREEYRRPLVLV